jgi:serine/threonine-protein kinase
MGALARAILHDRPPPLALLRPDVDPALISAIERAMAPDPRQRFGSAEEMRAALHGRVGPVMAGVPLAAPLRPPTKVLEMPVPAWNPRLAGRTKKALAALAVLAAMIVVPFAIASDPVPSNAPAKPVTTSTPSPAPVPVSNPVPPPPPTAPPPGPPRHGPGKGHGKGHGGDGGD